MKIKFKSYLLLSVIFSGILSVSCKKEQITSEHHVIPANDLKIASMIKNFKARGESGFKSTSEMTPEEANWLLSSTVNFTFGDGNSGKGEFWTESCVLTLPITDGKISETEVYNKYLELVDTLRTQFQSKPYNDKQLISVNISTLEITSSSLICNAVSTFAYGSNVYSTTFNDVDYWGYWRDEIPGICDGPNAGNVVALQSDAALETQKKIMATVAWPYQGWVEELPNNEGFIDILDPKEYPIDPNVQPSNIRYSHLYWNSTQYPDLVTCIPPADLNFYLSQTKDLIYKDTDHEGLRPLGSSLIDIKINGIYVSDNISSTIEYFHQARIHYGIFHFSGSNPIPLD